MNSTARKTNKRPETWELLEDIQTVAHILGTATNDRVLLMRRVIRLVEEIYGLMNDRQARESMDQFFRNQLDAVEKQLELAKKKNLKAFNAGRKKNWGLPPVEGGAE